MKRRYHEIKIWWIGFLSLLAVVLSFIKVWTSVEKVDLAYELEKIQKEYSTNLELKAKLMVEKNNLLSPARLKKLAREMGFFPPDAKRVRKIVYEQKEDIKDKK